MSKRPGKGDGATAPSSKGGSSASDTTISCHDDEKAEKLAAKALQSIRACYRMCFAAVLADVVVAVIDGDLFSKFFGNNRTHMSWVDYVDFFDSMAFFTFGYALYRISSFYEKTISANNNQRGIEDENFLGMLRSMSISWGIISINFALVAVSMATALPTHSRDGPFHSLLNEVSPSKSASFVAGIVLIGGVAIDAYCGHMATLEDFKDNKRISRRQIQSKKSSVFAYSRKIGYRAYRNQALCVGSFTLTSIMELLKWAVDGEGGIVGRLLSISDVLGPFTLSWLLFSLNKSFLRAAINRLRDAGTGIRSADDKVYDEFFIAQTGFYENAAEAMKGSTIFRLLPYFVRPFGPQILSALEAISPLLAEKVVQLWDAIM